MLGRLDVPKGLFDLLGNRLGGVGQEFLPELLELLELRRGGLELLAGEGRLQLDHIRHRLGGEQIPSQFEGRLAVGARGSERLFAEARQTTVDFKWSAPSAPAVGIDRPSRRECGRPGPVGRTAKPRARVSGLRIIHLFRILHLCTGTTMLDAKRSE